MAVLAHRLRVLVVDDDPNAAMLSSAILSANGCEVTRRYDPFSALETAPLFRPDVLLTDVAMPGMLGIELACKVMELLPSCRIVFHTGESRLLRQHRVEHFFPNVTVLEKPVTLQKLLHVVVGAAERKPPASSWWSRRRTPRANA